MCNHANREAAMTVLGPQTCCDPCLTPLIKALNDGGVKTTSSCCGHHHRPGWVSLADGRWLMIAPDDEWMNWLSSRTYERVGDMPGHEPIYVPEEPGYWCSRCKQRLGDHASRNPGTFTCADGTETPWSEFTTAALANPMTTEEPS